MRRILALALAIVLLVAATPSAPASAGSGGAAPEEVCQMAWGAWVTSAPVSTVTYMETAIAYSKPGLDNECENTTYSVALYRKIAADGPYYYVDDASKVDGQAMVIANRQCPIMQIYCSGYKSHHWTWFYSVWETFGLWFW